jgi:hypothetical protein
MKRLVAILATLTLAVSADAADKIESAFGLTLGAVFEPRPGDVCFSKIGYGYAYFFAPNPGNSALCEYQVFVSPNTHRIYRIVGIGLYADKDKRLEIGAAIETFLQNKYGEGEVGAKFTNHEIAQGSRHVTVIMSGRSRAEIGVVYEDKILMDQARREDLENQVAERLRTIDGAGL